MKYIILFFTFAMSALWANASTPVQVNSITHTIFIPRQLGIDETVELVEKTVATLPCKSYASYRLPLGMMAYTSHDAKGIINTVYVDGEWGPWDEPVFDGFVEYDLIWQ